VENNSHLPPALSLLSSERPRNLGWLGSAGLLFGDWGTSRLYVLGFAFLVAGRSSFWLVLMMSFLILAVGWAYTQICRIYPQGGGVYTAARQTHPVLGVIGALLLFADYTITASLSALEAFNYFGLGESHVTSVEQIKDAGHHIELHGERHEDVASSTQPVVHQSRGIPWNAVCAIGAILLIGALNLMGPKHSAGPAIFAAVGMIAITLLVTCFALPQVDFSNLNLGNLNHPPMQSWQAFVAIVLALSGVEAIASLTGVMKKPVYTTARKAIWVVALEVAIFNVLLAVVMCSIPVMSRDAHTGDMMAHMAKVYVGPWGEWPVRIIAGLLLLSATNTAIGALMGTLYVMSRDGELPALFQKLNGFGAPWIGAVVGAGAPAIVLVFVSDLEQLGHLYAIGIVGAVAINCLLSATHPRLRTWFRKGPMLTLGVFLVLVWITLAYTKVHALIFVAIVMIVGLTLRQITRWHAGRARRPSLLRQAIMEQLPADVLAKPKILLATAGSATMAARALEIAKNENAALVVCFVRQVALNYLLESQERRLTIDTDLAANDLFADFLAEGHKQGVPIIPVYDTGPDAAEMIAEHAAMNGVNKVLMGTSRRGALHQLIKGSFQRKLESLLPPEIPVQVLTAPEPQAIAT